MGHAAEQHIAEPAFESVEVTALFGFGRRRLPSERARQHDVFQITGVGNPRRLVRQHFGRLLHAGQYRPCRPTLAGVQSQQPFMQHGADIQGLVEQ